nr:unnamed protein product [Callosobruchus chinensis]
MEGKSKCNMDTPQRRSCKMCDIIKKVEEGLEKKTGSCVMKENCSENEEPPIIEEPPKQEMGTDIPKESPKKEAECKVDPAKQRYCQMCQIIKKIESNRPEAERTEGCESKVIEEKQEKPHEEECDERQVICDDFCTRKRWAKDSN